MILDARVTPRASRNAIETDGERLIARVTAAPDGGTLIFNNNMR